jgi:hypothetical protein
MNRRGIELQTNFLVMLILSLAAFAVGLFILAKIMAGLQSTKGTLNQFIRDEIEKEMLAGQQFAVYQVYVKIPAGQSDNEDVGLGIRNDLEDEKDFYILVECDSAYDKVKMPICDNSQNLPCGKFDSKVTITSPITIKAHENTIQGVSIRTSDMDKGIYVYNIRACLDSACTDKYAIEKLRIEII